MKSNSSLICCTLLALLLGACAQVPPGLRSNSFEQRFPVTRCGGKVQVKDPDPATVFGQFINQSKGIWLLSPYMTLRPPKYSKSAEDLDYIDKMHDFLVQRIEDKFRRERWVEDVVPFQLEEASKESVVSQMVTQGVRLDTINYGNWKVPLELIREDIPGYSLFLFVDGQVGFDNITGYQNILYLFLIDNQTRKTTYSDYLRYECDVRNTNGLDKVLDYAYLKLLTLRFPPDYNSEN